jgi:hypothetical protein
MRIRALCVACAALVGAFAARDARAVGTRTFELDTLDRLSGGDLKGVSVGSDGVVRAGWTLGDVPLPEGSGTTATCSLVLPDGSVLVGTGPSSGGKVVRIAADRATVFADTHESAVNALVTDRAGTVFAATTSNKIYKVSQGKADVFATLAGVDSVLALVADPRSGALYAGTGSEGKVMRVEPNGTSSVFLKVEEPFVMSLAAGDDGTLYAGTGGKGVLYRITAAGRANVVYDFRSEDVHAVATGPNHFVWAIVNEGASSSSSDSSESSSSGRHRGGGRAAPGPASYGHTKPGKGSLWRFDAQGRPERVMHHDDMHYLSLALDDAGVPYVGTGAEGRVYTVDDAHQVALVADTDERQIGALHVSGKARFAIGSDPVSFHRVISIGGPDSVWTSKALDAGLRARFGHLRWNGGGSLEVSTRTGDTHTPDATWSPWSAPVALGGASTSPPGRFLQVRARMRDAAATVGDVTVPFVTENLRAVVTEVAARPKGAHEPKDKEKDGNVPASGSEPPRHDPVLHVSWKVDNPDNDELRYRVQFRREGGQRWIDATTADDVLTHAELDWDTSSLPEGKYRVRVDASDELANPPSDTQRFALETSPVLVDNTPPVFKLLAVQGRRLRAEVVDGLGPIVRIEAAVDGQTTWRPLTASDGILDTADESVDADVAPLLPAGPGPHIIAVRAYDAAGNSVVRETEAP